MVPLQREIVTMRPALVLMLVIMLANSGNGQSPTPNPTQPNAAPASFSPAMQRDLQALQTAALASDYAYNQVRHLCDNIGPRLTGSAQAAGAVQYVAQELRDLGLEVQLDPVTVRHWVRGREEAQLLRYPGQIAATQQKIVVTSLGNAVAAPEEGLTAPVVVAENFEAFDRLSEADIKGKIVLFNHAFDEDLALAGRAGQAYDNAVQYRKDGASRAAKKGAVAVLVRSVGAPGFRLAHTGALVYQEDAPKIPAGAVTTEDADLIATLAGLGPVEMHLVLTPRDLPPEQSYNVVADLKGSEHPEQVIIVSGHVDSWDLGTGAIDDASGIGIAMDVVRIIRSVNPKPKRTLRFIGWMNEENGLAGGAAYAEQHKPELANHIAAIEIDLGDGRPLGFEIHATPARLAQLLPTLHALGDPIGGVVLDDDAPGADLSAMDKAGVPTISPLQDARHYFDYHHTAGDTFDKVHEQELRLNVEALSALAYVLAQQ
jgi:carboxypeptidase Q